MLSFKSYDGILVVCAWKKLQHFGDNLFLTQNEKFLWPIFFSTKHWVSAQTILKNLRKNTNVAFGLNGKNSVFKNFYKIPSCFYKNGF